MTSEYAPDGSAMDLGISGRCAAITGGSRGIGLATARALLAEGVDVLLVARSTEQLNAAMALCDGVQGPGGRDAGRVKTLALDITTVDAGEILLASGQELFGEIDILVNSAGAVEILSLADHTEAVWNDQWEINVRGPERLMRSLVPEMAARGWGRVVNISSVSGKRPSKRWAAYSVTKAAELSLSRVYAEEYAGRGVLVNAVTPGVTLGEMWEEAGGLADQAAAIAGVSREEVLEGMAATVPRQALGSVDEIAGVITFLCSQVAANVVGSSWSVDGGAMPGIL